MSQDRKQAAKAAREFLLAERVPAIETLAEAQSKVETLRQRESQARQDREAAERELREAFEAAQTKGWTTRELGQLGYTAPRVRNRSTGSQAGTDTRTVSTPPVAENSADSDTAAHTPTPERPAAAGDGDE